MPGAIDTCPPGPAPESPLARALAEAFGERVRADEPLARHTSWRIGGPADFFVEVESPDELARLVALARRFAAPATLLGSGTNVLVSDRGVRGIVVRLGRGLGAVEWTIAGERATVHAGAAIPFKKLVYDAVERGFAGLEFGEGIPGSLGGGLVMNAGAFGGEIGRVVEVLEGVDETGAPRAIPRAELAFAYRRLDLPPGFWITGVVLGLERGDAEALRAAVRRASEKRKATQPRGFPNAGSVFKNPGGGRFAGKLLEEAGVKGLERGGAKVADTHANFVLNAGGATAADVRALLEEMQRRVLERSGVRLEPEVRVIGEW